MRIYIVRWADSQTLFGVVWANSIDELFCHIDELTDPYLTEYMLLTRSGGILFEDSTFDLSSQLINVERSVDVQPVKADCINLCETTALIDMRNKKWRNFENYICKGAAK